MDLTTDLASRLRDLTESIDAESDGALADSLSVLTGDLRTAVSSYLGLRLALVLDGWPIILTAFGDNDGVRPVTSLGLDLSSMGPGFDPESRIVFYAGRPGAFVDLAADVGYLQRRHGHGEIGTSSGGNPDGRRLAIALDADLPPVSVTSGLSGLAEYETINLAVGVLIARGHTADRARADLRRGAAREGLSLADYAARVVAG